MPWHKRFARDTRGDPGCLPPLGAAGHEGTYPNDIHGVIASLRLRCPSLPANRAGWPSYSAFREMSQLASSCIESAPHWAPCWPETQNGNPHRVWVSVAKTSILPSFIKRRRRDSNSRCPFGHTGFRDRRIRPLCHLSGGLWDGECNFECELFPANPSAIYGDVCAPPASMVGREDEPQRRGDTEERQRAGDVSPPCQGERDLKPPGRLRTSARTTSGLGVTLRVTRGADATPLAVVSSWSCLRGEF